MITTRRILASIAACCAAALTAYASASDVAQADARYLRGAWALALFQQEAARMARERAADDGIKAYAENLDRHHAAYARMLESLASQKGIQRAEKPDEAHARVLRALAQLRGGPFDQRYAQWIGVDAQAQTLRLYETEARHGGDPALRQFAEGALADLRKDVAQGQALDQRLGQGPAGAERRNEPPPVSPASRSAPPSIAPPER